MTIDKSGQILTDETRYSFVFYDFRDNDDEFQNTSGFCGSRNEVIEKCSRILSELGFRKNEVQDFEEYWRIKLPPGPELCVFPQDNTQLDRLAELKFNPAADKITRMIFMVVIKNDKGVHGSKRFSQIPQNAWEIPKNKRAPSGTDHGLQAREWGVAFSFMPDKK